MLTKRLGWVLVLCGTLLSFHAQAQDKQQASSIVVSQVVVEGSNAFSAKELHALVGDAENKALGLADLQALAGRVTAFYHRHRRDNIYAILPPQDFGDGRVRILVVKAASAKALASQPQVTDDAFSEAVTKRGPPAAASQTLADETPASLVNAARTIERIGVGRCKDRFKQVTSFVTSGSLGSSFYFMVPGQQPDNELISISVAETYRKDQDGLTTAYASASFAPDQANGCSALYEAVVYWPTSCDTVVKEQYSAMKTSRLSGLQVVSLSGMARVFLMPAGKGCITIKKEILE